VVDALFLNIVLGIAMGTLARVLLLRQDYRQYPSYPNGFLIQTWTGFIASALGAVALPALLTRNFIAVTFLAMAMQQFRGIRQMERTSLQDLETTEFVPRGAAYIDGIAKTFESRNYLAMLVGLITTSTAQLTRIPNDSVRMAAALALGFATFLVLTFVSRGKVVGDIASVSPVQIRFEGSDLYAGDIWLMNVGPARARDFIEREGIAVLVTPKRPEYEVAIANYGQRQAMAAEAARALGLRRYVTTRRDFEKGTVVVFLVPVKKDPDALVKAVELVPLLESSKKESSVMKVFVR